MLTDYRSRHAQALRTYEVPGDFADWPPNEQEELIVAADLAMATSREQALRLDTKAPDLSSVLDRDVRKLAQLCAALREARGW